MKIIGFLILISTVSYSQTDYIYFDIVKTYQPKKDTISIYFNNINYYFFLDTYNDTYKFNALDLKQRLILSGYYKNSKKKYYKGIKQYDSEGNLNKIEKICYTKPLKFKVWTYYDTLGKIIEEKKW
jgi:hypothetical protein